MIMRPRVGKHTAFWIAILIAFTFYYGRVNGNYAQAFYFASLLMPVAVGTAYYFNYWLVPRYLFKRKYGRFAVYLIYMVIITIYLEAVAMVFSFVVVENFQLGAMNPLTTDPVSMAVAIYLIVLVIAFVRLATSFQNSRLEAVELKAVVEKERTRLLVVISDRKQVPIPVDSISYIESLADYVQIFHSGKRTITKEKIGKLENSLPNHFIRIHRSFIVNKNYISSFDSETVQIENFSFPIGRKYKNNLKGL